MDRSKQAVSVFDKHAQLYVDKYMDVALYAEMLTFLCDELKQNANVLELGCGPGNVTKFLLNRRPDLQILGTDLSENMIRLAVANNPNATFQLLDCRKIISLNQEFDVVVCSFILPYLLKEETIQLFQDCSAILNPSGWLYLSTMEDDYSASGLKKSSKGDEIFIHFYESDFLSKVLFELGFDIIKQEKIKTESPQGIVTDLVMIAQKR